MKDSLVLSVAEAAEALGVSDDLVYTLTDRGELPCVRIGRRKLIPRRAVELMVDNALTEFAPHRFGSTVDLPASEVDSATTAKPA